MEVKYVNISEIKINKRLRKEAGDIEGLSQSIQEYGLLHPLIISSEYFLITGFRRLMSMKKLNWENVPVLIMPDKMTALELLRIEKEENLHRLDFTQKELFLFQKKEYKMKEPWYKRWWTALKKAFGLN